MRVALCNSALFMAAAVLAGCLREIHYTSAPGASGLVLDSVDHSPVPGAIVTLIPEVTPETIDLYSHKIAPVTVRTSRLGAFQIPQQRDWLVYDERSPALYVAVCAPALLRVQQRGYELFETNIATSTSNANRMIDDFKAGDIYLRRVSK
jgi:hypothetical protein